jgi:ABC-2 type transport system permease protein
MMLVDVFAKSVIDRWRAMAIGATVLGLLFLGAMAVYRTIDISVYTSLPEALLSMINVPADADVASLAYGAVFTTYGALTLAGLAIAAGSAAMAGEERSGTIGLLLANPVSRANVVISKAASMALLTTFGAVILWIAGRVSPLVLDVSTAGIHVEALILHLLINALFYGFLAWAIGAWTGRRGLAAGVSSAVMVVGLVAVGVLPLIEGWEDLARFFPWYYFTHSAPQLNGVDIGHLAVLSVGIALFVAVGVVGVDRRDLRDRTAGVSLLDRVRANALVQRLVGRRLGRAWVSSIAVKTMSDHQILTIVVGGVMFLLMGLAMGPMYVAMDAELFEMTESLPEALLALIGGQDMSTPEGFYQAETFSMMAPIATIAIAAAMGGKALAGEEAERTMGLLLSSPVSRTRVVVEKSLAMMAMTGGVGFMIFAGVIGGSWISDLGMSAANVAATSALATLLGLFFGAMTLALSAATGRVALSVYTSVGVALALYLMNAFFPLSDQLADWARWSPFYYYLTDNPLAAGMPWGHGAVLVALTVVPVLAAIVLFNRRDLRQG